jgi:uncharacterized lipoprotein YehR (DUF1307 family)
MTDEITLIERPSMQVAPKDVANELSNNVQIVQHVMKQVMKEDQHYGKIPGCGDRPTLLKPGAEVLSVAFGLAPTIETKRTDLNNGHREYEALCRLVSRQTGIIVGEGVGICSTMESKYRYRNTSDYELTYQDIPKDAKECKKEYRSKGYGMKKVDGVWEWVKYLDSAKQENPDIADTYNTVLKMAKKRAFIDAVLTSTAASDMFTQDIEDMDYLHKDVAVSPPSSSQQPRGLNPALTAFREIFGAYVAAHKADGVTGASLKAEIEELYGAIGKMTDDELVVATKYVQDKDNPEPYYEVMGEDIIF